ncbi:MAG: molybdopterin dinucleotide binding domain-containing protein, partial [Thermoplasmata archaeon]
TMRVWVSSLPGSGIAKINPEDYEKLELTEEDQVEVKSTHSSITLNVARDDIYEESVIRLRKQDADALKVRNGDAVFVIVVKKKREETDDKKKKK